jgi:hypothetical protein
MPTARPATPHQSPIGNPADHATNSGTERQEHEGKQATYRGHSRAPRCPESQ